MWKLQFQTSCIYFVSIEFFALTKYCIEIDKVASKYVLVIDLKTICFNLVTIYISNPLNCKAMKLYITYST